MPDRAQHTALESLPPDRAADSERPQSNATAGGGGGAAAGVTGDDTAGSAREGSSAYPADNASPTRGGSAPDDR